MKMKKLLLSLGSVAAIATPVAAVVACSSNESTAIYTQFAPIAHVEYKTDAKAPFYLPALGNTAVIENAGKEYLVPLSYLTITPAVEAVIDENGNVTAKAKPATAQINATGLKDTLLTGVTGTALVLHTAIPSGTALVVSSKDVANIGAGKAVIVNADQDGATLATYLTSIMKTFVEGVAPAEPSAAELNNIYVTNDDAKKAKLAFNKAIANGGKGTPIPSTETGTVAIMTAIRNDSIAKYFDSIKAK